MAVAERRGSRLQARVDDAALRRLAFSQRKLVVPAGRVGRAGAGGVVRRRLAGTARRAPANFPYEGAAVQTCAL
jgi:hypothetical protein